MRPAFGANLFGAAKSSRQNSPPTNICKRIVRFAQSVLYAGAGIDLIWTDLAAMAALALRLLLFPPLLT
ncbi:MAG: hypothetical protein E5V63_32220 [Mesorhizobium sp.]|nr:MAG: hypothetical protein E5W59_21570 [Mesorhizobium sp.]TIW20123.1 MAG: hypothetical protein E5V63_32220 [Mesorhizobium sp.]